VQCDYNDTPN